MPNDFDILVDSDAFVGLFVEHDVHHTTVHTRIQQFRQQQRRMVTTSFVVAETATVISHRIGQVPAQQFLTYIRSGVFPVIFMSHELQDAAETIFLAQETKGTSMVDCANVAVMQQFHIPEILSFDSFYFKKFHLQPAVA